MSARPTQRLARLGLCGIGAAGAALALPSTARAEGTDQVGTNQYLLYDTQLYVDIIDPADESISWSGTGTLAVYDPDDVLLAELSDGESVAADSTKDGVYTLVLDDDQYDPWDIAVSVSGAEVTGRLWTTLWELEGDDYAEVDALNASFYVLTGGGSSSTDAVVELRLDGFVGYAYTISANSTGVDGEDAGRSVTYTGNSSTPEFPVYLDVPEVAVFGTLTPTVSDAGFDGGATDCSAIAPGITTGEFVWTTDVEGSYHVVCDLSGDGVLDLVDDEDLVWRGTTSTGDATLEWDGTDSDGTALDKGDLDCEIRVVVGETHFVAEDVETSYEGMRFFSVDSSSTRTGLSMFWNDSDVQDNARTMESGDLGLETSGPEGVSSGADADDADPNVNARSWGDFSAAGKGNAAYLDTYGWVGSDTSSEFTITVLDGGDEDGDSLSDIDEECTYGTDRTMADTDSDGLDDDVEVDIGSDPNDADTDGDGLSDGEEGGTTAELDAGGRDTDEDGTPDWADEDSDDDGRTDAEESAFGDTDGDGDEDWIDDDDDGDTIPTAIEDDQWSDDADGDGTPNYRDDDSDGDGLSDEEEGTGDSDSDGRPDFVDVGDRDEDGIDDVTEGTLGTDPDDADSDDDGVPDGEEVGDPEDPTDSDSDEVIDALDPDDDDDGVDSVDEDAAAGTDTDGDGVPDYLDTDSDDDGVADGDEVDGDTDGDGAEDRVDDDDDGDGVDTADETGRDTDGDGVDDYLDDDDDGDGHLTADELAEEAAVGGPDIDGDGDPAWLDTDSDGDGLRDDDPAEQGDADNDGIVDWLDPLDQALGGRFGGGGIACATTGARAPGLLVWLAVVGLALRRRR